MTKEQYAFLTEKEKIFADILLDIAQGIRRLREDISRDIEETLKP